MKNVAILLAVVAMLALTAPVYGGVVVTWNGDGDGASYDDPNNWDLDRIPNSYDEARINDGSTVTIDVDFATFLSGQRYPYMEPGKSAGSGEYYMTTGGKIIYAHLRIGHYLSGTATGKFTQDGGEVGLNCNIDVGYGGNGISGASATYRISGGKIDHGATNVATILYLGHYTTTLTGRFEVVGTGPTSIRVGDFASNAVSILAFELDDTSTGAAKIVVNDDVTLTAGAKIEVTKSGTLGNTEFLLMTCGDAWTGSFALDASALGTGWSLEHRDNGGVDELWLVPEPATMVLLGIGGIGVLIRRRRR